MIEVKYNKLFYFFLLVQFFVLINVANTLDISSNEAKLFFGSHHNILWYLIHICVDIFGQNNIALRLPFILFYIGSLYLSYKLTSDYFKKEQDRILNIVIFAILPGLVSAALLVNEAIIVVFFTLLYLYLYKLYKKEYYVLLVLFLFIDNSFAILYLALFFYSLTYKKDKVLMVVSLILFAVSMQMYGFDVSGKPKGYLFDTFGIFASIFSPLLFLYFFYVLYRVANKKGERDLYWYISFTALVLALIFSLRQRVRVNDFAPFVVIATPLMIKIFMHSFRIRLKEFRNAHKLLATALVSILIINYFIILFNKPLYLVLNNPNNHFARDFHFSKVLAKSLKDIGIKKIDCYDKNLLLKLKFYGIEENSNYLLTIYKQKKYLKQIDIFYHKKLIQSYYIKHYQF